MRPPISVEIVGHWPNFPVASLPEASLRSGGSTLQSSLVRPVCQFVGLIHFLSKPVIERLAPPGWEEGQNSSPLHKIGKLGMIVPMANGARCLVG